MDTDLCELLVENPGIETLHESVDSEDHGGGTQPVLLRCQSEAVVIATGHILSGVQMQATFFLTVIAGIAVGQADFSDHAVTETFVVAVIAGVAVTHGAEDSILLVELVVQVQTSLQ